MDCSNIFENDDFSADDSVMDPTFTPPKETRKRKSVLDEVVVPAKRKSGIEWTASNLIFTADFYEAVEKTPNGTQAKCATCAKKIRCTGEVTSNFISHLKVRHPEVHSRYVKGKIGPSDCSTSEAAFNRRLIHAIVDSSLPVSIVERQSFKNLFIGTGIQIMSRKTSMKKLDEIYDSMMCSIKEEMSMAKHFCTTTDIWSGNHRSFLGYTVHWLDQNFQRKSAALACKRLFGTHSAKIVAETIRDINSSFGLSTANVITTVTDNGSNFVKAFNEHGLSKEREDEDSVDDGVLFENDHLLQTIEKCNQLWKKCKWPKSSEIIAKTLGSALTVPVVTRWNSLYDAIHKLLLFKEQLNELCDELSLDLFTPGDIEYLESYKSLMSPIAQTLDFLQGEANVKYGCFIPSIFSLGTKLRILSKKPELLGSMSSIAVKLDERLRERFKSYFTLASNADIAIAAAVLTPDVKMKWLRVVQKEKPDCTEEQISKRVIEVICRFMANDSNFRSIPMPVCDANPFYMFNEDEDEDEACPTTPVTPSTSTGFKSVIANQLYAYLNDQNFGSDFWSKYGVLKEASIMLNTPLTSSPPVFLCRNRKFSAA